MSRKTRFCKGCGDVKMVNECRPVVPIVIVHTVHAHKRRDLPTFGHNLRDRVVPARTQRVDKVYPMCSGERFENA